MNKETKTKHTPGPWFFHNGNVFTRKPALLAGLAEREILVSRYDIKTVHDDKNISIEEMHANARLIASAPDLLEMIERVLKVMPERMEEGGELLEGPIAELLAKAKGEL